jgi:hypothetical protein
MNETVKQIAKKAWEEVVVNTPTFLVTKDQFEGKFAELIVEECYQVVTKNPNLSPSLAGRIMKEHFGVK